MTRRRVGSGQLSLLPDGLSHLDAAVLAFARDHQLQGRVSGRVQSQLGLCETRYYQLLAWLLDRPEAEAAEPELVAAAAGVAGPPPPTAPVTSSW